MAETQDTEITLGTGKLLGIFFGLVTICAVFFTMGYMLGHSAAPSGGSTQLVSSAPSSNTGSKPAPGNRNAEPAPQTTAANNDSDSSIYNPPSNKNSDAQPAAQSASASEPPARTAEQPEVAKSAPPELKNAGSGSYMVQVAAVSKQEDAEILVNALRKKQYPVFTVANVPGDSLFHVQVGPFSDPREAESMRSRLAGDGYNAIVKR
jgi:DedD protein